MHNYEIFVDTKQSQLHAKTDSTRRRSHANDMEKQRRLCKGYFDLLPEPKVPYTTLASTLKNLEKKKYLKSEKLGNSCRYEPIIQEDEYKKAFMGNFVSDYFKNSYKDLVSFFAKEEKISQEELKEILEMIRKSKS